MPVHAASRGAASLVALLLLLVAALLASAWSQRTVDTELRSARQQIQQARAAEAAEAGLAWAQAMLNHGGPIGDDCLPAGPATGTAETPADRWIGAPDAQGRHRPGLGKAVVPQAACTRVDGGWRCHCPRDAVPSLAGGGGGVDAEPTPTFAVSWQASRHPAAVDLRVVGCSDLLPPCAASGAAGMGATGATGGTPGTAAADATASRADAQARRRLTLARLPALLRPPAAALTLRGHVATAAALGVHNADAATEGLAVLAGGEVSAPALRLSTAPGAMPARAVVAGDTVLATTDWDTLFERHVGLPPAAWTRLPGTVSTACTADCARTLGDLAEGDGEALRVAASGPLVIEGPARLGRPERPLVLVVDGELTLRGAVRFHGLLVARQLRWDAVDRDRGAWVHGAVLLAGNLVGDGAPDLVYDPGLVRRLRRHAGSWLRVPGSWLDH